MLHLQNFGIFDNEGLKLDNGNKHHFDTSLYYADFFRFRSGFEDLFGIYCAIHKILLLSKVMGDALIEERLRKRYHSVRKCIYIKMYKA